jgi:hypothetical protein
VDIIKERADETCVLRDIRKDERSDKIALRIGVLS